MSWISNMPKIIRGAFVEYGISFPPLIVPFQFNPETISRDRSNSFYIPGESEKAQVSREYHQKFDKLNELREAQDVDFGSETISFNIRLDATDQLDEWDPITQEFGIAPQLSTLELMMSPKTGLASLELLRLKKGYTFTGHEKPPMILFIWGRKKVLAVNIDSMKIEEQEFDTKLNPIRAEISVDLTVIEGPNEPYKYTQAWKETLAGVNMINLWKTANVIVPF